MRLERHMDETTEEPVKVTAAESEPNRKQRRREEAVRKQMLKTIVRRIERTGRKVKVKSNGE